MAVSYFIPPTRREDDEACTPRSRSVVGRACPACCRPCPCAPRCVLRRSPSKCVAHSAVSLTRPMCTSAPSLEEGEFVSMGSQSGTKAKGSHFVVYTNTDSSVPSDQFVTATEFCGRGGGRRGVSNSGEVRPPPGRVPEVPSVDVVILTRRDCVLDHPGALWGSRNGERGSQACAD